MTKLELVKLLSAGYPGGLERYFDERTGETNTEDGDSLARFVVLLGEDFDENASAPDNLYSAIEKIGQALDDLDALKDFMLEKYHKAQGYQRRG